MTRALRHVGKIKQTDTRCVVVMMQIPGLEDHALICESDSLPDHYHQSVMGALESNEGQQATNFADELSRRLMFIANRGNLHILQALHEAGFLRKEHVGNIMMTPTPGQAYSLPEVLRQMGKSIPGEKSALDPTRENPNDIRFNPHAHNQQVYESEDKASQARGILTQAEYMERDAARLREQAYAIAPSLRPRAKASAPTPKVESSEAPAVETKAPAKKRPSRPAAKKKASNE